MYLQKTLEQEKSSTSPSPQALTCPTARSTKQSKEAAEFEAQDKKRKEAIDARNDADSMVFQTEKAIEEVGDKLDANDKQQ